EPLAQVLARDRARRDAHRRLARRRAAAAAVIADAVLLLVGVIGVARPELVLDGGVVAGALVGVLDHEADGRAGRLPFEHARENAHAVSFLALGGVPRAPGTPPVEVRLDVRFGQREPRRAAVDDA